MADKKNAKKAPQKPKAAHVTVDGQKYKVAPVFRFQGERYEATEAVKNKELIASLLEAKSFVIEAV